jgi:hypothetical protein
MPSLWENAALRYFELAVAILAIVVALASLG